MDKYEKETKPEGNIPQTSRRTGEPKKLESLPPITLTEKYEPFGDTKAEFGYQSYHGDWEALLEIVRSRITVESMPIDLKQLIEQQVDQIVGPECAENAWRARVRLVIERTVFAMVVWAVQSRPYLCSFKPIGMQEESQPTMEIEITKESKDG